MTPRGKGQGGLAEGPHKTRGPVVRYRYRPASNPAVTEGDQGSIDVMPKPLVSLFGQALIFPSCLG